MSEKNLNLDVNMIMHNHSPFFQICAELAASKRLPFLFLEIYKRTLSFLSLIDFKE